MVYVDIALKWMASLPWAGILEYAKSFAFPLAGVYIAHKFGSIQADIGRRQAATAAQSMATARNKLRLDLFERRFAVFEAANTFISKAAQGNRLSADDRFVLFHATKGAKWLFDEQTAQYITDVVFSDAYELVQECEKLQFESDSRERTKLYRKREELQRVFRVHDSKLQELMAPYLRFTNQVE